MEATVKCLTSFYYPSTYIFSIFSLLKRLFVKRSIDRPENSMECEMHFFFVSYEYQTNMITVSLEFPRYRVCVQTDGTI